MDRIQKVLSRYHGILDGNVVPKFKHSLPDSKIRTAQKMLESCELCERKCGANRLKGEPGWCKVGNEMRVSSMFEHYGEEPFLVPSFTVFFMSCTFSCEFCQNWTISQRVEEGRVISEGELAKAIDSHAHCRNVNLVGGDPVPYLPMILKTLKHVKADIPVVWNSNFYMSEKSMELLRGAVDVYLSDWKYWKDDCAKRLSKVDNYQKVVSRNHKMAFGDGEVVIRHPVMPGHLDCCTKPILKFIAENFGDRVVVNMMDQYRPEFRAGEHEDIAQPLSKKDHEEAIRYAEESGVTFIK
jgi:putative pyruvate formate lyase activating enzyme